MHLNSMETIVQMDTCPLWHEMAWIPFLALSLTNFVTLSKFTLPLCLNVPGSQTKIMIHIYVSLMCRLNNFISFWKPKVYNKSSIVLFMFNIISIGFKTLFSLPKCLSFFAVAFLLQHLPNKFCLSLIMLILILLICFLYW